MIEIASDLYRKSLDTDRGVAAVPEYVLARILQTPGGPSSIYDFENVGDFILSGIDLDGVAVDIGFTDREIMNLCKAGYLKSPPVSADISYGKKIDDIYDLTESHYDVVFIKNEIDEFGERSVGAIVGPFWAGTKYSSSICRIELTKDGAQTRFFLDYYDLTNQRNGGLERNVEKIRSYLRSDDIQYSNYVKVPSWAIYDFDSRVAELPLSREGEALLSEAGVSKYGSHFGIEPIGMLEDPYDDLYRSFAGVYIINRSWNSINDNLKGVSVSASSAEECAEECERRRKNFWECFEEGRRAAEAKREENWHNALRKKCDPIGCDTFIIDRWKKSCEIKYKPVEAGSSSFYLRKNSKMDSYLRLSLSVHLSGNYVELDENSPVQLYKLPKYSLQGELLNTYTVNLMRGFDECAEICTSTDVCMAFDVNANQCRLFWSTGVPIEETQSTIGVYIQR